MPNRALNNIDNFNTLSQWLDENLSEIKSFVPHLNSIPNVTSKGIYFWFMIRSISANGYDELSNYVHITQINPIFSIEINGVIYDLVYLGTAGTGKNGNSHLQERLNWHISQKHTDSSICSKKTGKSGHLSTLRAGLGALLSDDLILPRTEQVVNEFMAKYLKVFWIEYPDNIDLIDDDEEILIKVLKPLLNIKNNPNAKSDAIDNSSKRYRIRRNLVATRTKQRLRCKGEDEKIMKTKNPTESAISYEERIVTHNKDCVEYTVLQGEDIAKITRGIKELPTNEVSIKIFDSKNPETVFKLWILNNSTTGNDNDANAQNIFKYFSNSASKKLKEKSQKNDFSNSKTNWIKWWMTHNKIEEITVRVCPVN